MDSLARKLAAVGRVVEIAEVFRQCLGVGCVTTLLKVTLHEPTCRLGQRENMEVLLIVSVLLPERVGRIGHALRVQS